MLCGGFQTLWIGCSPVHKKTQASLPLIGLTVHQGKIVVIIITLLSDHLHGVFARYSWSRLAKVGTCRHHSWYDAGLGWSGCILKRICKVIMIGDGTWWLGTTLFRVRVLTQHLESNESFDVGASVWNCWYRHILMLLLLGWNELKRRDRGRIETCVARV